MKKAFSVVEVMLAVALFFIFSTGVVGLLSGGLYSNQQAEEQTMAVQYATEGLEAVRSIRNQGYSILTTPFPIPSIGVKKAATGGWTWNDTIDTWGKYKRNVKVENVYRDGHGTIVSSGGVLDVNTKKVSAEVVWTIKGTKTNSINMSTYLTKWSDPIDTSQVGGMAVFASGGTTGDGLSYRILNNGTGLWGAIGTLKDVDPINNNRVAKVVKLYSSLTRNEKVMVSKHINGTTEYLYAQTWNGSAWGNDTNLLTSPISATYLDNRNYDATYLYNGDLMVVYGDNTSIPKMRIWNGSTWSGAVNLPDIGGIPVYVALRSRVGTDEVMAVFFDQQSDTNSTYFNGNGYLTSNWATVIEHANQAPTAVKEHVDFTWSQFNYMRGALFYPNGNDKKFRIKIWIANGMGGGSWGPEVATSGNIPAFMGPTVGRSNSRYEQYLACTKNSNNALYCFESNEVPEWLIPTNYAISGSSHNGNQRSFDVGWKTITGDQALLVYSDNSVLPKYRRYNPSTNVLDPDADSTGMGNMTSTLVMVKICQQSFGDDMMVLMSDLNRNLYSVQWSSATGLMHTAPVGRAFGQLGATNAGSGSTSTSYWFDFAWDTYQ